MQTAYMPRRMVMVANMSAHMDTKRRLPLRGSSCVPEASNVKAQISIG